MAFRFLPHGVPCSLPPEDHDARQGKAASSQPGFLLGLAGFLLTLAGLLAPQWGRWLGRQEDLPGILGPLAGRQPGPEVGWLLTFLGLLWLAWVFGWWWRRTWRGAVVTGRNVASLALLQATAWTVLLVSLFVVVALWAAPGLGGQALDEEGLTRPDNPLEEVGVQVGAVAGTSAAAVGITAAKKRRVPSKKGLEAVAKAGVAREPTAHARRFAETLCGSPLKDRREQATLMLGTLAGSDPAADASSPEEKVRQALEDMAAAPDGQQKVERFVGDLLQGKVPADWDRLVKAAAAQAKGKAGALGDGLPRIDVTRDAVKRFVQAATLAEVGRWRTGSIYQNACACQARLTDMLEGDEVSDHESKDSSKIQFLLVTLGSLLAMAFWAWHQMDVGAFRDVFLPGLPEGMTVLSAATAAGYVGGKLPQRTPVEGLLP